MPAPHGARRGAPARRDRPTDRRARSDRRLLSEKGDLHEAAYLERLRARGPRDRRDRRPRPRARGAPAGRRRNRRKRCARAPRSSTRRPSSSRARRPTACRLSIAATPTSSFASIAHPTSATTPTRSPTPSSPAAPSPTSSSSSASTARWSRRSRATRPSASTSSSAPARPRASGSPSSPPTSASVRQRFLAGLDDEPADTYPEPSPTARSAAGRTDCDQRRVDDDHLSLVAGHAADAARAARTTPGSRPSPSSAELDPTSARSTASAPSSSPSAAQQAALQLETRETGEPALTLLEPERNRGFARLPEPQRRRRLLRPRGRPVLRRRPRVPVGVRHRRPRRARVPRLVGARPRRGARGVRALRRLRRRAPRASGPTSTSTTTRTTRSPRSSASPACYGSREAELDQLLRDGVFVDLYRVVARGDADRDAELLAEEGRGVLHGPARDRGHRRQRLGDRVRALARRGWARRRRPGDPRRDRRLQPRRLPLDAVAARLAARAARARRRSEFEQRSTGSIERGSRATRRHRARRRDCASSSRRSPASSPEELAEATDDEQRALAARPAARVPPARGAARSGGRSSTASAPSPTRSSTTPSASAACAPIPTSRSPLAVKQLDDPPDDVPAQETKMGEGTEVHDAPTARPAGEILDARSRARPARAPARPEARGDRRCPRR